MPSAVFEARRRAKEYWEIDGLPRLVSGAFSLLFAGLMLITNRKGWDIWTILAIVSLFVLWLFSLRDGEKDLIEWLKIRITYRRSGYVEPFVRAHERLTRMALASEPSPYDVRALSIIDPPASKIAPARKSFSFRRLLKDLLSFVFLAALAISWGAIVFLGTPWICVAAGSLTSILVFIVGNRRRDHLMWISVIGWIMIGIALAEWSFARHEKLVFLLLAMGTLDVLRGTATLLMYLSRNLLPPQ